MITFHAEGKFHWWDFFRWGKFPRWEVEVCGLLGNFLRKLVIDGFTETLLSYILIVRSRGCCFWMSLNFYCCWKNITGLETSIEICFHVPIIVIWTIRYHFIMINIFQYSINFRSRCCIHYCAKPLIINNEFYSMSKNIIFIDVRISSINLYKLI